MNNDNNQMTFKNFTEFYPYYLSEHQHTVCRRLHLAGSCLVVATLLTAIFSGIWLLLVLLPVIGYGFAWVGHFFFEKNRPATFSHPLYSFMGDWVMAKDLLTGRLPL